MRILPALQQTGTPWDESRYLTWKFQPEQDCPFLAFNFVLPNPKELNEVIPEVLSPTHLDSYMGTQWGKAAWRLESLCGARTKQTLGN